MRGLRDVTEMGESRARGRDGVRVCVVLYWCRDEWKVRVRVVRCGYGSTAYRQPRSTSLACARCQRQLSVNRNRAVPRHRLGNYTR